MTNHHSRLDALTLTHVSRSFGHTLAVDAVDLAVADGELMALVGPSGCGKSTLLRIVAGLYAAGGGTVTIGGELVDDGHRRADPEARDVGLVFQDHNLFPHLTVGQNITFGLGRVPKSERPGRRNRWLEMVGLPAAADRYPHELSGGERQRVALARALAPEPRLMLLDEPFASLDPNLRSQLRADIVGILRQAGTAAVIVTHDQTEAMAVGDQIAVMRAGRIEQVGSPETVFHQPANKFVAGFMGDAEFLPLDASGSATELGPIDVVQGVAGDLVMLRPDDVQLSQSAGSTCGRIESSEFRGETRSYVVRLGSGARLRSTQPHEVVLAVGSEVGVALTAGPHHTVGR